MSDRIHLDVSRETLERLEVFSATLEKWNPKINLVSKSTIPSLWVRHIADSVQVYRSAPKSPRNWVDIGSGGGLPGLIVACIAHDENPEMKVTLIESDQRKCAFLRSAARECGVKVQVVAKRIELAAPQGADVLSARALGDLTELLGHAQRHLTPLGTAMFPKGVTWEKEVIDAQQIWDFEFDTAHSQTEAGSVILKIKGAPSAK
jgi:16S rRNA (guanine527-N7)-methyltransferase